MARKKHYRDSTQEDCIDAIKEHLIEDPSTPLEYALSYVSASYSVPNCTLQRWYKKYISWGEFPHETKKKLKKYKKKSKNWNGTRVITDEILASLSNIIDDFPKLYLDEIAEKLGKTTRIYLPISTIYKTVTK